MRSLLAMDVQRLLDSTTDAFTVGRAFGPAYERGDSLIIPVAWVVGGTGGGGASGPSDTDAANESGGAGFGGIVWPLGVYVVRGDSARWVPALDVTRLALS